MMKGVENALSKHPEIKTVANVAGEWDATKAHAVISTVIQQNPDLCGIVGFWDVMDLGAAAAIKESGKPIVLVTSGGGEQMACDNVEKGVFYKEIAYQVMDQGRDLNDMISTVLETGLPAGKLKAVIYSPQLVISKETLHPGLCWSASALKK
jgi:ribose transport system substrate-binding protein